VIAGGLWTTLCDANQLESAIRDQLPRRHAGWWDEMITKPFAADALATKEGRIAALSRADAGSVSATWQVKDAWAPADAEIASHFEPGLDLKIIELCVVPQRAGVTRLARSN
jgi:hypothetical protein